MRILSLFLAPLTLLGLSNDIQTFSADFTQVITDEKSEKLVYHGQVWTKRPQKALWHYTDPIEKMVYISGTQVQIVEPDLEQVIVKALDKDIDLNTIIRNAKKLSDGTYEAYFQNQKFILTESQGVIETISYTDSYENDITITFNNQQQNLPVNDERFTANYPADYDVIR
jgi:outer membrane lipoprotein carrier protein